MPVSFPTNPTVGQTYTFGGVTWQWNGTTWVNAASGTAFVPVAGGVVVTGTLPYQGVTDGSSAAAGQVGEFLTATATSAITFATWFSLTGGNVNLTPGDWDVWGSASFSPAGGVLSSVNCGLGSNANATPNGGPIFAFNANPANISTTQIPCPMVRFNVTTLTSVWLTVWASQSTATSCNATVVVYARRVR
jgi:hypothetical protein